MKYLLPPMPPIFKPLWLVFLLTCLPCGSMLLAQSDPQADPQAFAGKIRALVEESFDADGPGVAILVSRNGEPLHLSGFGMADVKAGKPITPDSVFDLASVSKQFTGAAILSLAEKGQLDLDAPVSTYLTDYSVPVKGRPVTVSDLLHHVSGLADYCSDDWTGTDEEFAELTTGGHLEWLNTTQPRRAPGMKFEYNNSGYATLSLIVGRVSGQTFATCLKKYLFQPAGMHLTVISDGTGELPDETVKGYLTTDKGKIRPSSSPTVITGDGNIYTSIRELAKWDAAIRRFEVLNKDSQTRAWSNGTLNKGRPIVDDEGDGYGRGWSIDQSRPLVSHTGSWDGTSTCMLMDLENGLTVVVLSNDENADTFSLGESILAIFRKQK